VLYFAQEANLSDAEIKKLERLIGESSESRNAQLPSGLAQVIRARIDKNAPRITKPLVYLALAAACLLILVAGVIAPRIAGSRESEAAVARMKAAFNGAESVHLVDTSNGNVRYDLWFGQRHIENGKVCWSVAIPNGKEPVTVPFIATPVPECDMITLRLELDPPGAARVAGRNEATVSVESSHGWTISYDAQSGLPIKRTRANGSEVLLFEFNKALPRGLAYTGNARPHVQIR
jgi:hypothetical protein